MCVAFTSATFSTRNWQTTMCPLQEDQCSGVLPLKISKSNPEFTLIFQSDYSCEYALVNAFMHVCCVGLGVVLLIALFRARGVCKKMQQNKIEVASACGGHNIGLASDEDGCCCLHLQNNGKASPRREGQHVSLCSQVVRFRGQPTLACIDCANHSIASARGMTSSATDKRPQRRAAAATSASATRQLRNTP